MRAVEILRVDWEKAGNYSDSLNCPVSTAIKRTTGSSWCNFSHGSFSLEPGGEKFFINPSFWFIQYLEAKRRYEMGDEVFISIFNIRMTVSKKCRIVGVVLLASALLLYLSSDYTKDRTRKCVVLDKINTGAGYKVSAQFYLIMKEERGIVFDLSVGPATYSQADIGEVLHFNLSQQDIKQTSKENLLYFFGPIIFVMIGLFCLLVSSLEFFE